MYSLQDIKLSFCWRKRTAFLDDKNAMSSNARDAAYDTSLTFLLSNISCCYPKSLLGILLREKCIYSSGSCPPSHSQSSFRKPISSYLQALKPKVKIAGGKELIYREGETATIFAEVPSEPAANEIRDWSQNALNIHLFKSEEENVRF